MLILLDTGILLRLTHRADLLHPVVRYAVRELRLRGHSFVATHQNIAEFWNVCTRPVSARGGLGITLADTGKRLRIVERVVRVVPEPPAAYDAWKQLVVSLGIKGVQVHDARLAAAMTVLGITQLLTLNQRDFARFTGIVALDPISIAAVP